MLGGFTPPLPTMNNKKAPAPSPQAAQPTSAMPSIPALPVKEIIGGLGSLAGGVGNAVGGLITSENWWIILLIVFLLYPDFGTNMLGGLFKGTKA